MFFSKTALTTVLVFGLKLGTKYVIFTFNCNETLGISDLEIVKKIVQIEVFGHFLDFALLIFRGFPHNDR